MEDPQECNAQVPLLIVSVWLKNEIIADLNIQPDYHHYTIFNDTVPFFMTPAGRFGDADQAVFGMMAQKIAALEEYPYLLLGSTLRRGSCRLYCCNHFPFFRRGFVQLRIAMLFIVFPGFLFFYFDLSTAL